ncbi:ribose-5-phosphate isomerase RpiA [Halovenus marina]|uniref:ribose-5-phosphate isomerase RpiA n=1 Tax=Halovenus marina TaxID=3396621 RepID=UPI003F56BD29
MTEDRTNTEDAVRAQKRRAAESAVEAVSDGMVVGLGSGSTAAHAIRELGQRVDSGLDIEGIPTSYQARELAAEHSIPLTTLDEATPDIAIDGADQVSGAALVKGGGAAHAREKLVDGAADRLLVVVDQRKESAELDHPVPVEVLPDARRPVTRSLRELGGDPVLRDAERKSGPVVTDNGNLVVDCDFGVVETPADLGATIDALPGVLAHGLFVEMADEIHVGAADGVRVREC